MTRGADLENRLWTQQGKEREGQIKTMALTYTLPRLEGSAGSYCMGTGTRPRAHDNLEGWDGVRERSRKEGRHVCACVRVALYGKANTIS